MAILVKHSKVSAIPDDADTSLIRPSDWNADHTLTGTIDIANGGTGQTTANAAFNALAPSQTGNTGKYLTTNGTDTSWATNPLGTVTSVAATAGTGISITGSPITTSGTLNITNTAPDQTVSIASGTGISATGTYPAFTVANTGVTSAVAGTGISVSGSTGAVTITNTAPDQTVALTGAGTTVVTGTYPNFTITSTDSTTGTVTSVAATAGTGISVTGSPITTSGTLNITNTAPDQTVAIASGTGISVTGTYPNFTVTNTSPSSGGTVTSVTGTAPVVSSGGNTPAISMAKATTSVDGYLSSTDWTTFNNKGSGTVTSVTATSPVTSTGGTTPVIAMPAATTSVNGYLTSTDWTTFNNKSNTNGTVTSVAALTLGTTGTDLSSTVVNGTTTPVITLQVPTASATNRGALSSADWTTFNGKANAFTYTSTYIPFGQGTTTPNQSANLTFDGTTLRATDITDASLTSGRVVYAGTGGNLVDSSSYTFDGTTETAPIQRASNGIVTNNKTIGTSFTIPATDNAMSSGPVTISSGVTVTVSSGSRWVVL
jgi:hypothetical protein